MSTRWERRQRKYDRKRYGMRVSGGSIKNLPTGARRTYVVHVQGVGSYTVHATEERDAIRQARKRMNRINRARPYTVEVR